MKRSALLLLKIFSLLLCLSLTASCYAEGSALSDPEANLPSSLGAQSYCLMDARDRSVLCENNASLSLPMASTTKIMTAVVVLSRCDLNQMVEVSSEAVGIEGSSMYLSAGEKISVRGLLYGLLLESANDAAVALAIHAAGSVEKFAQWMNELAQEIGMTDSAFCNPSGLSQEGHCASARDLALLMCYAMKDPVFREITSSKTFRLPMGKEGEYRYLSNHNRLLDRYEHCIGGKTGYTLAAGRCLVTVSQNHGVELVAVTMNDRNDWNDHISLYEYGFSLYSPVTLCQKGEVSYPVRVVGGVENQVVAKNAEELSVVLRSSEGISVSYELPFFIYAPVTSPIPDSPNVPIPVGRAVYYQNETELGSVELYCENEVEVFIPPSFWEKIIHFFQFKG